MNRKRGKPVFSLDKNRNSRAPWTRGVLGTFVIVCLNLALQPCAMAIDGNDDGGCPHCPPSESQEHQGHHGSPSEMAGGGSCASASGDCSLGDGLNHDSRSVQPKLKDLPAELPLATFESFSPVPTARHVDLRGVCPTRSPPSNFSPPLNVLYCVYLD